MGFMDIKRAQKYGINVDRYKRIMALPGMNFSLMELMYNNGYDFSDTSNDLTLFAEMQTFTPEKYNLNSISE